jgi:N12 class adenine-specific DNA methylase
MPPLTAADLDLMDKVLGDDQDKKKAQPAPYLLPPRGQVEPGNIDLTNRPIVKNPDGSISTVRSASFNFGGREVLLPTISDDGRNLSKDETVAQYRTTGRHLGVFDSPQASDEYAQQLHEDQAKLYGQPQPGQTQPITPAPVKPPLWPGPAPLQPRQLGPETPAPTPQPAPSTENQPEAKSENPFEAGYQNILQQRNQQEFKDRGFLRSIGTDIAGGLADYGELGLRSVKTLAPAGSALEKAATSGVERINRFKEETPFLQQDPNANYLSRSFHGGIRSAVESVAAGVPTGVAGAVLGSTLGPLGTAIGGVIGYAFGASTQFGLSQYDDVMERGKPLVDQGKISRDALQASAIRQGLYEGGFEFAQDLLEGWTMGAGKLLTAPAKEAVQSTIRDMFKINFKTFAKQLGQLTAIEAGGEMLTSGFEAMEDKRLGLGNQTFWDGAVEAFGPTVVSSIIFAGIGHANVKIAQRGFAKALENPDTKLEHRVQAVNEVYETLKQYDETVANVWQNSALQAVLQGKAISTSEDVLGQKPEEQKQEQLQLPPGQGFTMRDPREVYSPYSPEYAQQQQALGTNLLPAPTGPGQTGAGPGNVPELPIEDQIAQFDTRIKNLGKMEKSITTQIGKATNDERRAKLRERLTALQAQIQANAEQRDGLVAQREPATAPEITQAEQPDYEAQAKALGIQFAGFQERKNNPPMPMFNDNNGATFTIEEGETLQDALNRKRGLFEGHKAATEEGLEDRIKALDIKISNLGKSPVLSDRQKQNLDAYTQELEGLLQKQAENKSLTETQIDQAAHEAATSPLNELPEPTEAQIEAGNYKKGHIDFQGLDISVENPRGSTRKGVSPTGKPWETELTHHYGYIKGTVGKDKDHIDSFIGPDVNSGRVFVVDQEDPETGKFDEHKVMLGFPNEEEARQGYLSNYAPGWKGLGAMTEMSMDEFKTWIKEGDTKKPIIHPPSKETTRITPDEAIKYHSPGDVPAEGLSPQGVDRVVREWKTALREAFVSGLPITSEQAQRSGAVGVGLDDIDPNIYSDVEKNLKEGKPVRASLIDRWTDPKLVNPITLPEGYEREGDQFVLKDEYGEWLKTPIANYGGGSANATYENEKGERIEGGEGGAFSSMTFDEYKDYAKNWSDAQIAEGRRPDEVNAAVRSAWLRDVDIDKSDNIQSLGDYLDALDQFHEEASRDQEGKGGVAGTQRGRVEKPGGTVPVAEGGTEAPGPGGILQTPEGKEVKGGVDISEQMDEILAKHKDYDTRLAEASKLWGFTPPKPEDPHSRFKSEEIKLRSKHAEWGNSIEIGEAPNGKFTFATSIQLPSGGSSGPLSVFDRIQYHTREDALRAAIDHCRSLISSHQTDRTTGREAKILKDLGTALDEIEKGIKTEKKEPGTEGEGSREKLIADLEVGGKYDLVMKAPGQKRITNVKGLTFEKKEGKTYWFRGVKGNLELFTEDAIQSIVPVGREKEEPPAEKTEAETLLEKPPFRGPSIETLTRKPLPMPKEPFPGGESYETIPYTKDLNITNLDQLPKGSGAPFLLAVKGEGDQLVAKQWKRAKPKALEANEVMIDMNPKTKGLEDKFPPAEEIGTWPKEDLPKLEDLVTFPKNANDELRLARLNSARDKVLAKKATSVGRYNNLRTRGEDAVSDYDKMMGYHAEFNMRLSTNHITAHNSYLKVLEDAIAEIENKKAKTPEKEPTEPTTAGTGGKRGPTKSEFDDWEERTREAREKARKEAEEEAATKKKNEEEAAAREKERQERLKKRAEEKAKEPKIPASEEAEWKGLPKFKITRETSGTWKHGFRATVLEGEHEGVVGFGWTGKAATKDMADTIRDRTPKEAPVEFKIGDYVTPIKDKDVLKPGRISHINNIYDRNGNIEEQRIRLEGGGPHWNATDYELDKTKTEEENPEHSSNYLKTVRDLGDIGTKVQFNSGFNKEVFTVHAIEEELGKVQIEKGGAWYWPNEFDRVTTEQKLPGVTGGKKPSEMELAGLLIDAGLMRPEDKGKKQYAYTFRNAIPNDKWNTIPQIINRLFRPGGDAAGSASRDFSDWVKAGILDRRYREDGWPIYAWHGAVPEEGTFTPAEYDKYLADKKAEEASKVELPDIKETKAYMRRVVDGINRWLDENISGDKSKAEVENGTYDDQVVYKLKDGRNIIIRTAESNSEFHQWAEEVDEKDIKPFKEPTGPIVGGSGLGVGEKEIRRGEINLEGATLSLQETTHTKTGVPLFVVTMSDRVSREAYTAVNKKAREFDGWYSAYRKGGAIPGFQFKTREAAENFMKSVQGTGTAAAAETTPTPEGLEKIQRPTTSDQRILGLWTRANASNGDSEKLSEVLRQIVAYKPRDSMKKMAMSQLYARVKKAIIASIAREKGLSVVSGVNFLGNALLENDKGERAYVTHEGGLIWEHDHGTKERGTLFMTTEEKAAMAEGKPDYSEEDEEVPPTEEAEEETPAEEETSETNVLDEIDNISDEELENMAEEAGTEAAAETPPPTQGPITPAGTGGKRPSQPREKKPPAEAKPKKTLAEILTQAAGEGVKGADEAITGLYELFGGKSLKSLPGGLDENTYAKAKPHFEKALEHWVEAGKGLKELFNYIVDTLGDAVKPYFVHFAKEKRDERKAAKAEKQRLIDEKKAAKAALGNFQNVGYVWDPEHLNKKTGDKSAKSAAKIILDTMSPGRIWATEHPENTTPGTFRLRDHIRDSIASFKEYIGEDPEKLRYIRRNSKMEERIQIWIDAKGGSIDTLKQWATEYGNKIKPVLDAINGQSDITRMIGRLQDSLIPGMKREDGTFPKYVTDVPFKDRPAFINQDAYLFAARAYGSFYNLITREWTKLLDNENHKLFSEVNVHKRGRNNTVVRTGLPDYLGGRTLKDTDDFNQPFQFKGVGFGEESWINQAERNRVMHAAFDAFKDLASTIGANDRGMSIGGELAVQFANIGHKVRMKGAAAAFFRGINTINFTRDNGDGSMAHEWGHAIHIIGSMLDSNFKEEIEAVINTLHFIYDFEAGTRMADSLLDKDSRFLKRIVSSKRQHRIDAVKEEVRDNFEKTVRKETQYLQASTLLNADYTAKQEEMWARAFEAYVYDTLSGRDNYLVNDFVAAGRVGGESDVGSMLVYPSGKEREEFNASIKYLLNNLIWDENGKPSMKEDFVSIAVKNEEILAAKLEELLAQIEDRYKAIWNSEPSPDGHYWYQYDVTKFSPMMQPDGYSAWDHNFKAEGQEGEGAVAYLQPLHPDEILDYKLTNIQYNDGKATYVPIDTGGKDAHGFREDGEEILEEESSGDDEGTREPRPVREDSGGGSRGSEEGTRRPGTQRDEAGRGEGDSAEGVHPTPAGNYRIKDPALNDPKPVATRFINNLAALRVLNLVESENRSPTWEEKNVLANYSGWGGMAEVFAWSPGAAWIERAKLVKAEMTDKEIRSAERSSPSAYYTPVPVGEFVWKLAQRLGFKKGIVFDPAVGGNGLFLGTLPDGLETGTSLQAVEMDNISARIATKLYEKASIQQSAFQDVKKPNNRFDLALTNVPFENLVPSDTKHNKGGHKLHNYYINKMINLTAPGALTMAITTTNTLDKPGTHLLEYAEKADLVGAIRLPSGIFSSTQVPTDLLVFRKKIEGSKFKGIPTEEWTVTGKDTGTGLTINNYFLQHPDMIAGKLEKIQGRWDDDALRVVGEGDLQRKLEDLAAAFPENIVEREAVKELENIDDIVAAPGTIKEGGLYLNESGKVCLKENGEEIVWPTGTAKEQKRAAIGKGFIEILDSIRSTLRAQRTGMEEEAIKAEQSKLKKAYNAFVKKFGPLNDTSNLAVFDEITDASWVIALEDYDPDLGKVVKLADIFTKNIAGLAKRPDRADTDHDALSMSLDEFGYPNLEYMARLRNSDVETVLAGVADKIIENPETGFLETMDQYLSGNVKRKLLVARDMAKQNPELERNVRLLEAAQPEQIPSHRITARIGATWIDPEHLSDFVQDKLNLDPDKVRLIFNFNPATNEWNTSLKTVTKNWKSNLAETQRQYQAAKDSIESTMTWGTDRRDFFELIDDALKGKRPVVTATIMGVTKLDEVATRDAERKLVEIQHEFGQWLFRDSWREESAVKRYNELQNTSVPPQSDGSHLTFPGKSLAMLTPKQQNELGVTDALTIQPHQMNAVWKFITGGNIYLAHEVGLYKTATMAMIAMESKRLLGKKKVLYVTLNDSTMGQAIAEIKRIYPLANVMPIRVSTQEQRKKKALQKMALNDFDIAVMRQQDLNRIGLSPDTERIYMEEEIAELREILEYAKAQGARLQEQQIQTQISALEEKIKKSLKLYEEAKAQQNLYFDDLGIDMLIVDEAHGYKNVPYETRLDRIVGLNPAGSPTAKDFFYKTRYMNAQFPKENSIVLASGSPLTNSIAEMYNLQRMLQPKVVRSMGTWSFDRWIANYGDIGADLEWDGARQQFKNIVTNRRIVNAGRLLGVSFNAIDAKKASETAIRRPKIRGGEPQRIVVKPNEYVEHYKKIIYDRAVAYDADPKNAEYEGIPDNMLRMTSNMSAVAIDQRLLTSKQDSGTTDSKGRPIYRTVPGPYSNTEMQQDSKIYVASRLIRRRWEEEKAHKGVQLVFADMGVPSRYVGKFKEKSEEELQNMNEDQLASYNEEKHEHQNAGSSWFNTYDSLKEELIKLGIPSEQIAFIHDTDDVNKDKKAAKLRSLFKKVNSGEIRVMIGSTSKAGTGINVQERISDIHHLDVWWNFSAWEQRNGRGIRSGNIYANEGMPGTYIWNYVTETTVDATRWDKIFAKGKVLNALLSGDINVDVVEDISEETFSAKMLAAVASGNPLMSKQATLLNQVSNLRMERSSFAETHRRAANELAAIPDYIATRETWIDGLVRSADLMDKVTAVQFHGDDQTYVLEKHGKEIAAKVAEFLKGTVEKGESKYFHFKGDQAYPLLVLGAHTETEVKKEVDGKEKKLKEYAFSPLPITMDMVASLVGNTSFLRITGNLNSAESHLAEIKNSFLEKDRTYTFDRVANISRTVTEYVTGRRSLADSYRGDIAKAQERAPKLKEITDLKWSKEREFEDKSKELEEINSKIEQTMSQTRSREEGVPISEYKGVVPILEDVAKKDDWREASGYRQRELKGIIHPNGDQWPIAFRKEMNGEPVKLSQLSSRKGKVEPEFRDYVPHSLEVLLGGKPSTPATLPFAFTEETDHGRVITKLWAYSGDDTGIAGSGAISVNARHWDLLSSRIVGKTGTWHFAEYGDQGFLVHVNKDGVRDAAIRVQEEWSPPKGVTELLEAIKGKPSSGAQFSLKGGPNQAAFGVSRDDLQKGLDPIIGKWTGGPAGGVRIVQAQKELPQRVQDQAKGRTIEGVFDSGTKTIWVVADNIPSMDRAQEVIAHEAYGHYGLEAFLGEKKANAFLGEVVLLYGKAGLQSIAEERGFDLSTKEGRLKAAGEKLAQMAETNERPGLLKRIYAAVREAMRQLGFTIKLNDGDIQAMLARSRRWVEEGGKQMEGTYFPGATINQFAQNVSMSLKAATKSITDSPEFKRWFGESKVLDENGHPLVVYHGTVLGNNLTTSTPDIKVFRGDITGAIYFSKFPEEAEEYTKTSGEWDEYESPQMYAAYLRINNPYFTDNVELVEALTIKEMESLKRRGYDGIIFDEGQEIIVFSPTQIKSIFNRGTWDANNPDILFSLSAKDLIDKAQTRLQGTPKAALNVVFGQDTDISDLGSSFRIPAWLAKTSKAVKTFFDRQNQRDKDRSKLYHDFLRDTSKAFDLNDKEQGEFAKLAFDLENKKVANSEKYKKTGTRDVVKGPGREIIKVPVYALNDPHYRELDAYLQKRGVSDSVRAAYMDVRRALDSSLLMIHDRLADIKGLDPDLIEQYRNQMGRIHNYFPHNRYGDWHLKAVDPKAKPGDETRYREHFNASSDRHAQYWYAKNIDRIITEMEKEQPGIEWRKLEWTVDRNRDLPEEVYDFPIPVDAMQMIVDSAVKNMPEESGIKDKLRKELSLEISNVLKSRGFGSHMIQRKDIPGFEKLNANKVLHDHFAGFAGWMTKMEAAHDFGRMLRDIDAKQNPAEYRWATRFTHDMLENQTKMDRTVDAIKSIFFMQYLGGNVKTMIVNLTQNMVAGVPRLAMDLGISAASKHFVRAAKDIRLATTEKSIGKASLQRLSADEKQFLGEMFSEGWGQSQFVNEVRGKLGGKYKKVLNKVTRAMGLPMEISERYNRLTLGLAAYRAAQAGEIRSAKVLSELGLKPGQKANHEIAKKFSEGIVNDAHFVYGKSNRPAFMRGSSGGKALSAAYTFRSFNHNMLSMWRWMLASGDKEAKKAFAYSIMAMISLGGLAAIPMYNSLAALIRELFGTDLLGNGVRKQLPPGMRDIVMYGAPASVGVNIGGSIGMELPVMDRLNVNKGISGQLGEGIGSLLGVPYSMFEELTKAVDSLKAGRPDRAAESVAPVLLRNIMSAVRLSTEGQTTVTGKPINVPGEKFPRKLTEGEAVLKGFGFQPVSSTKAFEMHRSLEELKSYRDEKQNELANRYVAAFRKDDNKEMVAVRNETMAWNRKAVLEDRPEMRINLHDAIQARRKAQQPMKQMRGVARELRESYGM